MIENASKVNHGIESKIGERDMTLFFIRISDICERFFCVNSIVHAV